MTYHGALLVLILVDSGRIIYVHKLLSKNPIIRHDEENPRHGGYSPKADPAPWSFTTCPLL